MKKIIRELKETGEPTNNIFSKEETHSKGICHGISTVALINKKGQLLIQKRSLNKKGEPGKWDLSSAGHIESLETAIDTAIRETYEEISLEITKEELQLLDTFLFKKVYDNGEIISHLTYLFLLEKDIDINNIKFAEEEISEIRYVNKEEYLQLLNNNQLVDAATYCNKLLDYIK